MGEVLEWEEKMYFERWNPRLLPTMWKVNATDQSYSIKAE